MLHIALVNVLNIYLGGRSIYRLLCTARGISIRLSYAYSIFSEKLQVSGYLLGEYSHLLAKRPGCSPKEIFHIIHDKFPTVTYALCPYSWFHRRCSIF